MRAIVKRSPGIVVGLVLLILNADIFCRFGFEHPQRPGTDANLVADRQAFAGGREAVDQNLLALRSLDIDVSVADSDGGMVEGGRESLEAQVIVGSAANIKRLDLDRMLGAGTLSAGAQLDLGKADAH